jgi:hypothetical protein
MGKFDMKISVNGMKTATSKGKQFARCETVLCSKKYEFKNLQNLFLCPHECGI